MPSSVLSEDDTAALAPPSYDPHLIVALFEKLRRTSWVTPSFDRTADMRRNAFGQPVDVRAVSVERFASLVGQRLNSHGARNVADEMVRNRPVLALLHGLDWTPTEVAHIILHSRALGLLD